MGVHLVHIPVLLLLLVCADRKGFSFNVDHDLSYYFIIVSSSVETNPISLILSHVYWIS